MRHVLVSALVAFVTVAVVIRVPMLKSLAGLQPNS